MHVIGALQGADDLDPASWLRERDGSLWFDIQLLLKADLEGPLDHLDILPTLQSLLNLAFLDFDSAVGLGGPIDIQNRLQRLVLDADRPLGGGQGRAVGSGDQQDRLLAMADFACRQGGLIVADQLDDVITRDVLSGDDYDLRPVEAGIECDGAHTTPRDARSDSLAVPRPGDDEVVGVAGAPRHLVAPLPSQDGASDGRSRIRHATKCVLAIPAPLQGRAARGLLVIPADIGSGGADAWEHVKSTAPPRSPLPLYFAWFLRHPSRCLLRRSPATSPCRFPLRATRVLMQS